MPEPTPTPRVAFHERTSANGGWRYRRIHVDSPTGDLSLHTDHPPLLGDVIELWDSVEQRGGTYAVVARQWLHSGYGSTDWPYGQPTPRQGPMLAVVVEAVDDVFHDEVVGWTT